MCHLCLQFFLNNSLSIMFGSDSSFWWVVYEFDWKLCSDIVPSKFGHIQMGFMSILGISILWACHIFGGKTLCDQVDFLLIGSSGVNLWETQKIVTAVFVNSLWSNDAGFLHRRSWTTLVQLTKCLNLLTPIVVRWCPIRWQRSGSTLAQVMA